MIRNRCVFPVLVALSVVSCGSDEANDSAVGVADTPEMQTCRMAAQSMIDIARQAVNDQSSRPERREARRLLLEDWVARLSAGEDPCDVYADIGQSSTTF